MKRTKRVNAWIAMLFLGFVLQSNTADAQRGRGGGGGGRGGGFQGGGRSFNAQPRPSGNIQGFRSNSYQGNRPAAAPVRTNDIGNRGGGIENRNFNDRPNINRGGNIENRNFNDRSNINRGVIDNRNNIGTRNDIGNRGDIGNRTNRVNDRNVFINNGNIVRNNPIGSYTRPPYTYGGRRYYGYHGYAYHAYRGYSYGSHWHPWGYFAAGALAATAVAVIVSDNSTPYYYDAGMWYEPYNDGYVTVQAPIDGSVSSIPPEAEVVIVNNETFYYYGGNFYRKDGDRYVVVGPPAGAVVQNLPEGGEEVTVGERQYVKFGQTYYQPIVVDGVNKWEVVQVQ